MWRFWLPPDMTATLIVASREREHVVAIVPSLKRLYSTWNFSHVANTITIPTISEICERQGYDSSIITTPNQLKGGLDIGR